MTKEIPTRERDAEPTTDFDRTFDEIRQRFLASWGIAPLGATELPGDGSLGWRAARTDVKDLGAAYQIVAEVPGIPKEQIDVRVRGSSVEIVGTSTAESETKDAAVVYRERRSAGFRRTLELPEAVVASEAKARVENGLLELELPKQHPTPSPAEVRVAVQ